MFNHLRTVPHILRRFRAEYVLAERLPDGTLVEANFKANDEQKLFMPRVTASCRIRIRFFYLTRIFK